MIDVGQSVGNYNITAKLGEGGMGMVFLAQHPVIGSKVALKAIHPQFARNGDVVSRFVTEAKSVNQIGHDHIVSITDFGNTPAGDFYFIMEYLQGQTLASWIRRHGPLLPARALAIAAQIADALQASHEHGVIHRDLKPENIFLIEREGTKDFVKVLDFGLAKLTGPEQHMNNHNTRAGFVMGTPYYMSPEQCEGKPEIDHRADVYALGVVLFEMLTGMIPFGGEGYGEIILKHITVPAPSARSIVKKLSPALDSILFRALSKDPAQRFQTMAQFRSALQDPEAYAAATEPAAGIHDDISARMRAALPMARRAIRLQPAPQSGPSTFEGGAGEIHDGDLDRIPRSRHGRTILAMGAAALAGMVIAIMMIHRHPAGLLATAVAPSRPATVRVNVSSDPDGATVTSADGTVIGTTPLSTEVTYGDTPIEYVIRKDGYAAKTTSIVPNLPSPVFAVLQRVKPPTLAEPSARVMAATTTAMAPPPPALPASPATVPAARARARAATRYGAAPSSLPRRPAGDGNDDDDVMELSQH
ncbi:MAG: eukaryotic-like serine/threonine-protein kinase [Myxococcales bacterium]|jgi:serine/threonine-protein kinase|nr:eukaryotic-like serine/threonine-protein kinase [Myxococcales bacterium]